MSRRREPRKKPEDAHKSFLSKSKVRQGIAALLLCLSGILVYSNTFHSPFHFDDYTSIVWNGAIHRLDLSTIWNYSASRFLTYLSLAVNYRLGQLDTWGYHLFNLTVHLGAGLAAWWLILLTFQTPALRESTFSGNARVIAFFAAVVVLVHPVQTQAVTYIVQRAASMTAAFLLLSLALYVKGRLLRLNGQHAKSSCFFLGAIAAGLCGMFSKETAYSLPAILILYEVSFFGMHARVGWKVVGAVIGVFGLVFLYAFFSGTIPIPKVPNISRAQYLLTQFRVLVTYVRMLIFPSGQNVDHDFAISRSLFEPSTGLSFLFFVALCAGGVALFRNHRLISFGIFWFVLSLMPESSFVPLPDVIFEHRLYLPMLGFSILLVVGIHYIVGKSSMPLLLSSLTVVTVAYGIAAHARNEVWKDELTLTTDVVNKSPRKARAYTSRGNILMNRRDYTRALVDFDRAVRLDSSFIDAYLNRGTIYSFLARNAEALRDFNKALQMDSLELRVYTNRAIIYMQMEQYDKSLEDLNRAIDLKYDNTFAYTNRGFVYFKLGDYDRAIADYDRAIQMDTSLIQAYVNRLTAYQKIGRRDLALRDAARIQQLGYQLSPELLSLLRSDQ